MGGSAVSDLQEFDALWAEAESRRERGEPARRHLPLAHSYPAGDSEISARAWLTEAEAERVHALGQRLAQQQREWDAGAKWRIAAKLAARREVHA